MDIAISILALVFLATLATFALSSGFLGLRRVAPLAKLDGSIVVSLGQQGYPTSWGG